MKTISAKEFQELVKSGESNESCYILDVREADEYQSGHIPSAKLISLSQVEARASEIPRDRKVYVYCRSGNRSHEAIQRLHSLGFENLINLEGGLLKHQKCGGSIESYRRRLPIMQQVQISAGLLVLLGILFSLWIHPAFLALSAFVGAGLVFAGISGFCGMAKLLERMPWNRSSTHPCQMKES